MGCLKVTNLAGSLWSFHRSAKRVFKPYKVHEFAASYIQQREVFRKLRNIFDPDFDPKKPLKQVQRLIKNIKLELRSSRIQEAVTFANQLQKALGGNNLDASFADCQKLIDQLSLCMILKRNDRLIQKLVLQEVKVAKKLLQDICDRCGYSS